MTSSPPSPDILDPRPEARPKRGLAAWSLVLGIVAFCIGLVPVFGAVVGVLALILALQARRAGQPRKAWIAGMVLSSIATVCSIMMTIAAVTLPDGAQRDRADLQVSGAATPAAASPAFSSIVREYWPIDDGFRVPNLVGLSLAEAAAAADEVGLELGSRTPDGEKPFVWVGENWLVVDQEEPAGTERTRGGSFDVVIMKRGDVTDEVDRYRAADAHVNERIFTGVVTAHIETAYGGIGAVSVDGRAVDLAWITPLREECMADDSLARAEAERTLAEQLPVGSHVLVVANEQTERDAFIHLLAADGTEAEPARPDGSANEQLIRTGWWALASIGGPGNHGIVGNRTSYEPYYAGAAEGKAEVEYAPELVEAAEATDAAYLAGAGECRRFYDEEVRIAIAEDEDRARESAEFEANYWAEWENRSQRTCRDGDGDGICYE